MQTALKSSLISLALVIGALFYLLPGIVFAKSNDFVNFQQSQLDKTSTYFDNGGSGQNWDVEYDVFYSNGFTGTTTGAFTSDFYDFTGGSPQQSPTYLVVYQYSDPGYTNVVSSCVFSNDESNIVPAGQFHQLVGGDCLLNSANYIKVHMGFSNGFTTTGQYPHGISGSDNPVFYPAPVETSSTNVADPAFFPQFALVTSGFYITPTASSSGLFLSGANEFCNSVFASSTAPGIASDIGIGLCDVGGFLFVPTQASMQQFTQFSSVLQLHVPFSYGYELAGIFENLSASSSENISSYGISLDTIDFASSTALGPIFPTGNFEFLGSTTINKYLPVGMHDLIYNLMVFMIWVEVAFVLYHKVVPTKANI